MQTLTIRWIDRDNAQIESDGYHLCTAKRGNGDLDETVARAYGLAEQFGAEVVVEG